MLSTDQNRRLIRQAYVLASSHLFELKIWSKSFHPALDQSVLVAFWSDNDPYFRLDGSAGTQ